MSDVNIVFDHVHLVSTNPQTTAAWYVEKLGGQITNSGDVGGAPQIYVAFQGATLIVRGQRPGEQAADKPGLTWGTDHFGFHVDDDLDGLCDALKKKGVVFTKEPVDFSPQLRLAFIEAPDGVSIELLRKKA